MCSKAHLLSSPTLLGFAEWKFDIQVTRPSPTWALILQVLVRKGLCYDYTTSIYVCKELVSSCTHSSTQPPSHTHMHARTHTCTLTGDGISDINSKSNICITIVTTRYISIKANHLKNISLIDHVISLFSANHLPGHW